MRELGLNTSDDLKHDPKLRLNDLQKIKNHIAIVSERKTL